jgi:hypothetical protein
MRFGPIIAAATAPLLCLAAPAHAFVIAVETSCYSSEAHTYHFSDTAIVPDFDVKVSKAEIFPDLTIKLVSSPQLADLVVVDSSSYLGETPNMRICISASSISGTVIKVTSNAIFPDITVELSESPVLHDYTLYVDSDRVSAEQAAALFAVIWKRNRK